MAHARVLGAFVNACATGDVQALAQMLAADVVAHTDSGGRARAARNPVQGADHVARLMVGVAKNGAAGASFAIADVNGLPAIVLREHGVIVTVVMLDVEAGVIRSIYTVRNPDKLSRLDVRCGG